MSIGKRVTYLRGLVEGLSLGSSTKEEKILHAIIGILDDISEEMEVLEHTVEQLDDDVTVLAEAVESLVGLADDCDCCTPEHHSHPPHDKDDTPTFYTVCCPSCQDEINIDEEVLNRGTIDCPNCSETLEFEFDEDEE